MTGLLLATFPLTAPAAPAGPTLAALARHTGKPPCAVVPTPVRRVAWPGAVPAASGSGGIATHQPRLAELPCVPEASAAFVGEIDAEEVADPTEFPFRTAVKLFSSYSNGKVGACSGALVGPHTVLTAGHCIYDNEELLDWADAVEVIPGYQDGVAPFGVAHSTELWTYVAYQEGDWKHDFALINLDRSFGDALGYLGREYYVDGASYVGASANMNHYPAQEWGDGETLYRGYDRIIDADDLVLYHELDSQPGSSGGVLYRFTDPDRFAWGVHVVAFDGLPYKGATRFNEARMADVTDYVAASATPTDLADLVDTGSNAESGLYLTGESIPVAVALRNLGTATASASDVDVLLSGARGEGFLGRLGCGAVERFTDCVTGAELEVPRSTRPGDYRVLIDIDPDRVVPEFEEDDNLVEIGLVTVREPPPPFDPGPTRTESGGGFQPLEACGCGATPTPGSALLGLGGLVALGSLRRRRR